MPEILPDQYLGDSVYFKHDGVIYYICTNNGIEDENVIYLESEVLVALCNTLEKLNQPK